jgi:hypothetical protein
MINSKRMILARNVARIEESRTVYKMLVPKPVIKKPFLRPRRREGCKINGGYGLDSPSWGVVNIPIHIQIPYKVGNFLTR